MNFNVNVFKNTLPEVLDALSATVVYGIIAVTSMLIWGTAAGTLAYARIPILSRVVRGYITLFRETPLLVQLYLIFYGLPNVGIMLSAPLCGVIALTLNNGSYVAEIIRGGLQSVERTQIEAANALGLHPWHIWTRISFPQAWKSVLDANLGMVSIIIKDTSLLSLISIIELTATAQRITSKYFEPVTAYVMIGALYLVLYGVVESITKLISRKAVRSGLPAL